MSDRRPQHGGAEAAEFERFGLTEAAPSIIAQAALYWCGAGEFDRAAALVARVIDAGIGSDIT
ncbi:hypothetical protein ACQP1G_36640 [Nocardia sp. CA-107356]|uniref:hypothetical protein n=1 Tax=Nocardia sp. CA-107356 TaxID=3239972 RepID=UPI003D942C96